MVRSLCLVLVAFTLGSTRPARANGTSVGASAGAPLGGITPIQNGQVRLVAEKLTVRLRDGAACSRRPDEGMVNHVSCTRHHYDVVARYLLDNPGRAAAVLYGVPLVTSSELAAAMARKVRIRVGGREHRCTLRPGPSSAAAAGGEAPEAIIDRLRKQTASPIEGMGWSTAWCVAPLSLPRGKVTLELSYSGELLWDDWHGPGCLYYRWARHLLYPLSPAGNWAGQPDVVEIRVELGRYAGITRAVGPAGSRREGSALVWKLIRPELKKVADLHLVLDRTRHELRELAELNGLWKNALVVEGDGRLVDGRLATEHCAPAASGVELRLAEHPYWYSSIYHQIRDAGKAIEHPRSMMWPGAVIRRVLRQPPRKGELELHRSLPGPLWDARHPLGFVLVPGRAMERVRAVRVGLCDQAGGQRFELDGERLDGPGRDRGRRALSFLEPAEPLRGQLLGVLDRWSGELVRAARPCLARCQARCRRADPKAKDERPLACRLHCETTCVHDAARAASPARRPCVRLSFEEARGKGASAGGPTCVAEVVPLFGSPCFDY
jgi:hypothetical protein